MKDCTGKELKEGMNIFAVLTSGGALLQGTVVGFSPKKVKVKRLDDGYVNTIMPSNILIAKHFDG